MAVKSGRRPVDAHPMDAATVTHWSKYGHDRWYVTATDGTKLGHWDTKAGQAHPAHENLLPQLLAALTEHHQDTGTPDNFAAAPTAAPGTPGPQESAAPPITAVAAVEPTAAKAPPTPEPELDHDHDGLDQVGPNHWEDLADRKAGAAAREQALALKAEAPVRTFIARIFDVKTDERAWRIGADGEEMIAKELTKLSPAWRTLHAVPVGTRGSDIDHVLIGPRGVFTINAKHHPGATIWVGGDHIRVNGNRQPYVRNARHEAQRASKLLTAAVGYPILVTGIIAFVRVDDIKVKEQPATDVVALGRREIRPWLAKRAEVLTPEQIEAIYAAARRSDTWQG